MFTLLKWPVKTFLFLTGVLPLVRCSSGYREKNGKVTFNGKEINDKNFIILNGSFAKDSTTAYYKDQPLSDAHIATFEAVDDHYAKDRDKVWYCDEYREGQNYYLTKKQTIREVQKAVPAHFVSLQNGYAKDNAQAYFQGIAFTVKDVATLTALDVHFAKDAVTTYLDRHPVPGSEGKTFEVTDDHFAKDSAHIYYYAYTGDGRHSISPLPCDKESFRVLDYRYSKDKNNVFFSGLTIKGADSPTFNIRQSGYATDKNAVYFESKRIAGADVASFEVYRENESYGHDVVYAKDNKAVYMNEKKVLDADPATFKVLGGNYGSDSIYVFYKTGIVKNAGPLSFKVYPHDVGNADAEDAFSKFHEGRKAVD